MYERHVLHTDRPRGLGLELTRMEGWGEDEGRGHRAHGEWAPKSYQAGIITRRARASGDSEDAEAIVYFFGGSGGSAEANVGRWIGQMQQPDGSASKDKARRDTQTINGLTVTTVDLAGTYVAEVRPGATERHNKPGFRLRAAVVETPRGAYYTKMTGPAKTMAAADADFKAFVATVRVAQ